MGIWLVDEQHRVVTPDRYHAGYRPEKIKEIEGVIYHFTASTRPDPTRRWLTRKDKYYVSAHFLVDRDGETWQMAALDERTYHAGGPSSKMFGRGNVNGRTIGIEIMNAGPIVLRDGKWYTTFNTQFEGAVVASQKKVRGYRHWEPYYPEQTEALVVLTRKLKRTFPVLNEDHRLLGHSDVDPRRKMDPGPLFPWDTIRST